MNNNTHVKNRLRTALENLPWLLQSKVITSGTHGGWDFRVAKDYGGDNSGVSIRKREGLYSQGIYFCIGEAGIQAELKKPFLNEGSDDLRDYFCDLTNPKGEEIQLFLTIHPVYCAFIIEVHDYIAELFNRNFSLQLQHFSKAPML